MRTDRKSTQRREGIGAWSASALIAGNMIGAGVFTTSGFALADLGSRPAVLAAWCVGGLIATCGAWCYVRLARSVPGSGGEYLFLSRAIHPLAGFLAGWISLLAGFTAPIAVAAHGLEAYVLDSFSLGWPAGTLGAGSIVAAGLAHGFTLRSGLRIQNLAVSAQVVAILGFIGLGAIALLADPTPSPELPAAVSPAASSISAFAVTLVWISFAYSGWNAAVYVADELRDPSTTLARATLFGTVGVVALYVLLNAVFVYAAPIEALSGRVDVGAVAAESLGGPHARRVLSAVVALGLATSISAMVMVGPRIYAKMAEDGVLPGHLRSARTPPRRAISLQVALALAAFFVAELRDLLLYVGSLLGISAVVTVGCLLWAPKLRRATPSPLRTAPWIPLVFIGATLGSVAFMIASEPRQALAAITTLLVGAALYGAMARTGKTSPVLRVANTEHSGN